MDCWITELWLMEGREEKLIPFFYPSWPSHFNFNTMKVRIQKINDKAVIPAYSKEGDAGMDLVATSIDTTELYVEYSTGLAVEIPSGYVGLVFARSSVSKTGWSLANGVGVIDSGYRGEICLRFVPNTDEEKIVPYNLGDRIGQLLIIPYPRVEFEEVLLLSDTLRGAGGFGSTGS